MDADERAIYHYIRSLRPKTASARDISRRTGSRRKFHFNPDWASPVLVRMTERGILETRTDGSYGLKPLPHHAVHGKRWAAPAIAEILKANGKHANSFLTPDHEDEYYESL